MLTKSHFETTVDHVDWAAPVRVEVHYDVDVQAGEVEDVTVYDMKGHKLDLPDEVMVDLYEEIWNDVGQEEDCY